MRIFLLLLTTMALAACQSTPNTDTLDAPATMQGSGLDLAGFDTRARPQDDFYQFANGQWLRQTEIPADRADYGSFTQLADEAEDHLLVILAELESAPAAAPGTPARMVRDFHHALTRHSDTDEPPITALAALLAAIDGIATHDDVWLAFVDSLMLGANAPLVPFVTQDASDATRYALHLSQAGLSLPDRDYYLSDDARFAQNREQLTDYAATLFELGGFDQAGQRARQILEVETRLAEAQWSRVQNRDPLATHNPMNIDTLEALAPRTPWRAAMARLDLAVQDTLIIRQPSYVEALDRIVGEIDVTVWQNWLRYGLIDAYAAWLGEEFFNAGFEFKQRGLRGIPEPRPLERRVLETLNSRVGMLLGQLYVERHFQPEAKVRMERLVANVTEAFRQSLLDLDWMTDATRAEALEKLSRFSTKIGYPDVWRDYDGLEIDPNDAIGNLLRSSQYEYRRNLQRLGTPIDRDEWFMTPQTVNAYYSPRMNEIVFPAAILQPPFFDLEAEDAVNYGGIGAVIGHELGHGFDDSGRQSDGDGNLRDWWTTHDADEYQRRAERLVEQYNQYNPIDDLRVDGRLTLGENIGDLGGLTIAWRAYQLALDGRPAPVLDGYTGAQRFFLGWAQVWRRKYQDEELRRRLLTDNHAPALYRVNGIVINMPAFHEAFDVQPGDGMWLDEDQRISIW